MTEDRIQQEIIMYYRNHYQRLYVNCLIFSIPNGGLRDKRTAMLMKSTGLLSGAADLVVIYFGTLVFVELSLNTPDIVTAGIRCFASACSSLLSALVFLYASISAKCCPERTSAK